MQFLGVGNAGVESLLININIFIAANILKYFGSLVRKKILPVHYLYEWVVGNKCSYLETFYIVSDT